MSPDRKFYKVIDSDASQVLYVVEWSMPDLLRHLSDIDIGDCKHIIIRELSFTEAQEVEVIDDTNRCKLSDMQISDVFSNII